MGERRDVAKWRSSVRDYVLSDLLEWCRVPADELESHPDLRVPFRVCRDSDEMGRLMAAELLDEIERNNLSGLPTRAIVPCGPMAWYEPFVSTVVARRLSLERLTVFHMDVCLDWQGRDLPEAHPLNFRTTMERVFYAPVPAELAVPRAQRVWPTVATIDEVAAMINEAPISLTLGGLGQDGHIAYNQPRRHPFSRLTIDELRNSTVRIQENGLDTMLAIAHRMLGGAYQFAPPMSITLGLRECLSAKRVRLFTDTGAWKQTALRVTLFGPITDEYPATLLQAHPDALITATRATASHPAAEHPDWDLRS
jgi:glucosamine-6-phosphate deaminase